MDDFIKNLRTTHGASFLRAVTKKCGRLRDEMYEARDKSDVNTIGGSPGVEDLVFLWLVAYITAPKNIIEIGSWLGTSAGAMAAGAGLSGKVYTCDKRDYFVNKDPRIKFHCLPSDEFLHCVGVYSLDIGMCFIDASLMPGDAEKIIELFGKNKIVIAIHDMNMHNGHDNMHRIISACIDAGRKIETLIPNPGGYDINTRCGLVREL